MSVIPLINLPSPFLVDDKSLPSLGILYIATSLKSQGYNPYVIDLNGKSNYIEYLLNSLNQFSFEFIGISFNHSQLFICENVINNIKLKYPNTKIIGGGPGIAATFLSKNKPRKQWIVDKINKLFDVCVVGDGEKVIVDIINKINLNKIIYCGKNTDYYMNNYDINTFPIIDRSFIDIKSYNSSFGYLNQNETVNSRKCTTLITQRGCPYNCFFCCSHNIDVFRQINIKNVINEIEYLYKLYDFKDFIIRDDEFNINTKRMEKFVDEIKKLRIKYNVDFHFKCFCVAKRIPKELRNKLFDVGLKVVLLGAESGDNTILKSMNKQYTVDDNELFINEMKNSGINVKCTFSLGHPGESNETLNNTDNWIKKVGLTEMNFTVIRQYPSSTYYDLSVYQNNNWKFINNYTNQILYDSDNQSSYENFSFLGKLEEDIYPTIFTDYLTSDQLNKWKNFFNKKYKM